MNGNATKSARVAGLSGDAPATRSKRQAISDVVADVLARRSRGQVLSDAAVLDANADLRPELDAELDAMREMHRIFLAARKAGPMGEQSKTTPADDELLMASVEHLHAVAIQGYSILHEISSGGQGTVYRAMQDATGRPVAIKVIPGGLLTGSRHRARFDREADILATLDHPNIVGILDRGRTADGSLFLVMPFIDGNTLDEHLRQWGKTGKADIPQLLRLFILIAQAIAEAHRKGIIHRDLKPANIRVDHRGHPYILDFGLARPQDGAGDRMRDITLTGQIVGSLPWTSPEQVSRTGATVDARTDVYALGVMLYQGLTDQFPYPVLASVREVLENIANVVPAPPSQTGRGPLREIDARLDAIVLRALAKLPENRYSSAEDLADDLGRYVEGKPLARETKPVVRRRRKALVLAAILSPLLAAAVATMLWPSRDSVRPFKLPESTNSLGMRFVQVPAGAFQMGSPGSESGRDGKTERQRLVRIDKSFFIGITEVTQRQYAAIMGNLPKPQADIGDDLPVQFVSWNDAQEFCRRLSAKDNRRYRLPSEAEWEYACRADITSHPFSGTGELETMGWYKDNSGGRFHTVATRRPNFWGIYDMHGNVAEWCQDDYSDGVRTSEVSGAMALPLKVQRGGSVNSAGNDCRSAARSPRHSDSRSAVGGFRVAMDHDIAK